MCQSGDLGGKWLKYVGWLWIVSSRFYNCFDTIQIVFELPRPYMSLKTTNPAITNKKTQDFRTKYKTEKCRYWIEKGFCPYSHSCTFAHSDLEIRSKPHTPTNYKTKPCINFNLKGYCPYGERCQYLHKMQENKAEQQEGKKTRSNSEQSVSSEQSMTPSNKTWQSMTHSKRIEWIQSLGCDYAIKASSRLLQLLKSNEHADNSLMLLQMFELRVQKMQISAKKYSL